MGWPGRARRCGSRHGCARVGRRRRKNRRADGRETVEMAGGAAVKIERKFTSAGQSPYAGLEFKKSTSEIRNTDGSSVFKAEGIDVPAHWSQVAVDILAQKYFRKAGVPQVDASGAPVMERGPDGSEKPVLGGERDARQVFHRLAGCWTHW